MNDPDQRHIAERDLENWGGAREKETKKRIVSIFGR